MDSMVNSWLYRASGNEGSVTTGVSTHALAQGRHGFTTSELQGFRALHLDAYRLKVILPLF